MKAITLCQYCPDAFIILAEEEVRMACHLSLTRSLFVLVFLLPSNIFSTLPARRRKASSMPSPTTRAPPTQHGDLSRTQSFSQPKVALLPPFPLWFSQSLSLLLRVLWCIGGHCRSFRKVTTGNFWKRVRNRPYLRVCVEPALYLALPSVRVLRPHFPALLPPFVLLLRRCTGWPTASCYWVASRMP